MKSKSILVLAIAFLTICTNKLVAYPNITFTSDGFIKAGDAYDYVRIYDTPPNHTTVTMSGGYIHSAETYDASTLTLLGGQVASYIYGFGESIVNVDAGTMGYLRAYDSSTVNFSGGKIYRTPDTVLYQNSTMNITGGEITNLFPRHSSVVNMSGGEISDRLAAHDQSVVNLSGGTITNFLYAGGLSTVNIFGYGFNYDPTGGSWGTGQLSGFWWPDKTPFTIEFAHAETYSHISLHEVPEPTTPPVADAGSDQTVTDTDDTGSEEVQLNGSGSSDTDGSIVSWVWTDDLGDTIPDGEVVSALLSVGTHTITLTITDNDGLTNTDTVTITVEPRPNQLPVADAGADQTVERSSSAGAEVELDGSDSNDPDGDALTYEWTWDGGSAVGVNPTVILPPGLTTVTLTVSDGQLSDTDTVDINVVDTTPPEVEVTVPQVNAALQDGVTLTVEASDISGVTEVYFYIREPDGASGLPIGYENLVGTLNAESGQWEYDFDTTQLEDGYYVILAKAIDTCGNEGWSVVVPFSIRNWAVVELLPASESNKAGRTMPVKFSLRIAESVDPAMPFVYNEGLEIRIYDAADQTNILQTSLYGDTSRDYRIDSAGELYITNFKTKKEPAEYVVEIWRTSKNFLVGSFTFETVK